MFFWLCAVAGTSREEDGTAKLPGGQVRKACCMDEIHLITAVGMTEGRRLVTCFTGAVQQGTVEKRNVVAS